MPILKIIFDICLLRGRPQDLPASANLVGLTALATVAADYAGIAYVYGHSLERLLYVVAQALIFAAVVWAALRLRGHPERWWQTVAALFAANAVFSFIMLPVLPQVVELLQQGPGLQIGWEAYFAFACSLWYFMVMTQVMRHAFGWSLALSGLASFGLLVLVRVTELALSAFFSIPVPT